jgi:endonuclease G
MRLTTMLLTAVMFVAGSGLATAGDLRQCPSFNKYGPPITVNTAQNMGSRFLCRKGYSLQHSAVTKGPLWVAEYLGQDSVFGDEPRTNDFQPDPDLPAAERSTLSDYKSSGFDRGHFAPAADFSKDADAMHESFYLSNMGPQEPSHNRGIWAEIEKYTRRLALKRKAGLYVITGPVHQVKNGEYVQSLVGSACPSPTLEPACKETFQKKGSIGRKQVYVPLAYYKVLLDPETGGTIAFVVPNMPMDKKAEMKRWVRSVREVEMLTNLQFFTALEKGTRDKIINKQSGLWTR